MLGWGRLRAPQPGLPRGGGRAQRVAVMVTYHLGQGLIVLALLGAGIAARCRPASAVGDAPALLA